MLGSAAPNSDQRGPRAVDHCQAWGHSSRGILGHSGKPRVTHTTKSVPSQEDAGESVVISRTDSDTQAGSLHSFPRHPCPPVFLSEEVGWQVERSHFLQASSNTLVMTTAVTLATMAETVVAGEDPVIIGFG